MCDFLVWNNEKDVRPFSKALQTQKDFYSTLGLDMLKLAVGVPCLCLRYLFNSLDSSIYFNILNKQNSDLHSLRKKNIVGGASFVFRDF